MSASIPFPAQIVIVIFCAFCSALFSGLTLGLLTLDIVQLRLIIDQKDKTPKDIKRAKRAKSIYRVRKDGNYLLITLLLGNVAANSGFALLLGDMVSQLAGFLISTIVITIAGEIVPQAVCSRHGLVIGGGLAPFVLILEYLLYPICKPLALLLNWILGEDIGNVYSKKELKALVEHHENQAHILLKEEAQIIYGSLDFAAKHARDCMTPIEQVFGVDLNSTLGHQTMLSIIQSGFSRIPVFDKTKSQCIVGLLFMKDIILMDPSSEIPVKAALTILGRRIYAVDDDTILLFLLRTFKEGHTHLAVVREVCVADNSVDPYYSHVGIITLEDVIEEILQDEIEDEFDRRKAFDLKEKVLAKVSGMDVGEDQFRNYFQSSMSGKIDLDPWIYSHTGDAPPIFGKVAGFNRKKDSYQMSEKEVVAVSLFLAATVQGFSCGEMDNAVLKQLISSSAVAILQIGCQVYKKDLPTDVMTLVLQGCLKVEAGAESLVCFLKAWSVLATQALQPISALKLLEAAHHELGKFDLTSDLFNRVTEEVEKCVFFPDYTATVYESNTRLLTFTRTDYFDALKTSKLINLGRKKEPE